MGSCGIYSFVHRVSLACCKMVIISQYGLFTTLISVLINILLAGIIFWLSSILIKVLGGVGSKALSKIMSLLLAAIAVMLVRKGLAEFFR